jgi:DNA-binding response OmpR family regulator
MPADGKKILIFEDNPTIALLLRTFFERRKYQVKLLGDGVEAVEAARDFAPDLILMDVIMPGKDGIETCTDLRREGVTTPVVMLTSKAYEDDKERGIAAGANAYLLKPFDPKKLEEVIAPLLR